MSLAIYAAPFNADSSSEDTTNTYSVASKRKPANNRTQRRHDEYDASKVNSVLTAIHASSSSNSEMADFKPIAPPVSVGVENTKINNPDASDEVDLRDLNEVHMNAQTTEHYYKQFMPAYQQQQAQGPGQGQGQPNVQMQGQTQGQGQQHASYGIRDNTNVIAKLNYMIHLLEEQKDERTNNVTEEVVLYSFLGIFVIFIVDSFVRVGKYVR
jgi:hypothetical protein